MTAEIIAISISNDSNIMQRHVVRLLHTMQNRSRLTAEHL